MNARLDHDDFGGWVQQLGDPIRARRAYCHLVLSGAAALPAIRAGLRHASADVRLYCTKALDRLVDPDSFAELVEMLCDSDARVRLDALHALACDRCKAMDRRPPTDDSLPAAIRLLRSDSDRHVRAMAAEVVTRSRRPRRVSGRRSRSRGSKEGGLVCAGWHDLPKDPARRAARYCESKSLAASTALIVSPIAITSLRTTT